MNSYLSGLHQGWPMKEWAHSGFLKNTLGCLQLEGCEMISHGEGFGSDRSPAFWGTPIRTRSCGEDLVK